MAPWIHPVLLGAVGILFINCGVLYMMFNSSFNEMCDYDGIVDTCAEYSTYMHPDDAAWKLQKKERDWRAKAYELRNQSEYAKCEWEKELQTGFQATEKVKAKDIATQCMNRFKTCANSLMTTTVTTVAFNCSVCQEYCRVTDWTYGDSEWAETMSYYGWCDAHKCPWSPECGTGSFMDAKCEANGCSCPKVTCTTTTTTITSTNTSTTITKTTATTTNTSTTSTTSTITDTTSNTSTTTTSTSTSITSTNSSTTSYTKTSTNTSTTTSTTTATTTNTTVITSTNTTTTTSTTSTTTLTTTNSTTLSSTTSTNTSTTTTTVPDCQCDPQELVSTVLVGRPWRRFIGNAYQEIAGQTLAENVKYWQGVNIGTIEMRPAGSGRRVPGYITESCFDWFTNRSHYYGPKQPYITDEIKAIEEHFDLGCGYTGDFKVTCSQSKAQLAVGQCSWFADISTCVAPTYNKALEECYTIPTTTPPPTNPPPVAVEDIIEVKELPLQHDPAPAASVPTLKPLTSSCCVPHVASVCRPDVNFNPGDAGLNLMTAAGQWQPERSINGDEGFFPMVPCEQQYNSTARPCPTVEITHLSAGFIKMNESYPSCLAVCNLSMAQDELTEHCGTVVAGRAAAENATHQKKIASMKEKQLELEIWTAANSMLTVGSTKQVVDCIDQGTLPTRYNSLALPKVRSGFDQMPLHNQCRLHNCGHNQCLEIASVCTIPYIHEGKENAQCRKSLPRVSFTCVDKVGISSSNPLSLGFGIAWVILGIILIAVGVGLVVRAGGVDSKVHPYTASD